MHDHDLDLIAEHASGLLAGEARARAVELVANCATCASEFADQEAIRRMLGDAPAPTMSEFERTRLRRSVLDEVAPSRSPISPWQRRFLGAVGAVAAVAVAVVGVGVIGQLGGEDSSAPPDEIAAEVATDDTGDQPMGALAVEDQAADRHADDGAAIFESAPTAPMLDLTDQHLTDTAELDIYLGELTASLPPDPLSVEDAVLFGAGCATSVDEPLLAVVLAVIDGTKVDVFLTGVPDEPVVTILQSGTCAPYAP
ncbi:MAG TPA: hypothetical protein VLB67_07905 [Acidimicrobiia bacterium]|nr:hypothetical protein [Acidimicrobiia bacterium]